MQLLNSGVTRVRGAQGAKAINVCPPPPTKKTGAEAHKIASVRHHIPCFLAAGTYVESKKLYAVQ